MSAPSLPATGPFDAVQDCAAVILGGGVAGLTAALELAPLPVVVLSKVPFSDTGAGGSSVWAQGGIAAAVGLGDSPALHAQDTLAAGAGLNDPEIVSRLTDEAPGRIAHLLALGTEFDRQSDRKDARLALGREAAHSRRRVLHADGDATGAEIVRALATALAESDHATRVGETEAEALVKVGERVTGVVARGKDGTRTLYRAPAVILATGGIGRLYQHTTNPPENTGDGLALAARVGARLMDLEMVQFHPTALAVDADPLPLLTEALRGEGAILVDGHGHRFMVAEHPLAELAPRDVVARALWRRRAAGEEVFLDAREAVGERFPERFPTVFQLCQRHGLDPRRQPLPVTPAAHFHMGGVAADGDGATSVPGLWVCGEAACTGAHGANRLASNSLLEGLVFGRRVAQSVRDASRVADAADAVDAVDAEATLRAAAALSLPGAPDRAASAEAEAWLRRLIWQHVGLVRTAEGLRYALAELERRRWQPAPHRLTPEVRNLFTVARLVTRAALARPESRGGHFRADFPAADPAWARHLFVVEGRVERGPLLPPTALPAAEPLRAEASAVEATP
jgi:L-aspartate oxidase